MLNQHDEPAARPGLYEQVDSSGAWAGLQQYLSAGETLPRPLPGHSWVCIDRLFSKSYLETASRAGT